MLRTLNPTPSPRTDPERAAKSTNEAEAERRKLYGEIYPDELTEDYSDAELIRKTGVPPHLFFDDEYYDDEERGRMLAHIIIRNRMESVDRFARQLADNARLAKRKAEQQAKEDAARMRNSSRSKNRRPKRNVARPTRTRRPTRRRGR